MAGPAMKSGQLTARSAARAQGQLAFHDAAQLALRVSRAACNTLTPGDLGRIILACSHGAAMPVIASVTPRVWKNTKTKQPPPVGSARPGWWVCKPQDMLRTDPPGRKPLFRAKGQFRKKNCCWVPRCTSTRDDTGRVSAHECGQGGQGVGDQGEKAPTSGSPPPKKKGKNMRCRCPRARVQVQGAQRSDGSEIRSVTCGKQGHLVVTNAQQYCSEVTSVFQRSSSIGIIRNELVPREVLNDLMGLVLCRENRTNTPEYPSCGFPLGTPSSQPAHRSRSKEKHIQTHRNNENKEHEQNITNNRTNERKKERKKERKNSRNKERHK